MDTFEILLIEDNVDERLLLQMAITASGISATVTCALIADEAVSRLNRQGPFAETPLPTLIILDLGLPGIGGKTLLQIVRNALGPQAVPVVVLTGSEDPADQAACASLGISAYVVKPRTFQGMVAFASSLPDLATRRPTDRIGTQTTQPEDTELTPDLIRQVQQLARLEITKSDIRNYLNLPDKTFNAAWKRASRVTVKPGRRGRITAGRL